MRGQINIAATLIGLGVMALTTFGFYTASNVRTDDKIGEVKQNISQVSERSAKLEEAIITLKQDNQEIKKDIKTILQILK